MGDFLPEARRFLLGLFAGGNVARGAAHQHRLTRGVEFHAALGRDPARDAIGQRQAEFDLVASALHTGEGPRVGLLQAVAIVGVHALQHAVEIQGLGRAEAEQAAPPLTRPHVVACEIANPKPKAGGLDGQGHACFALPQPRLAQLEFVDKCRRAQHVTAHLVPHHRDQAQVKRADENGDGQMGPMDQRGLNSPEQ